MAKNCPVFDLALILEVIKASKTLIENTNPDDLLIFIGQSPDYLSYLVEEDRKVISVPISGRVFGDEWSIPSKENLDKYCKLLNDLGITRQIFDTKNVVFIDHSHSGQSISSFAKVILRCLGYIQRHNKRLDATGRTFKFINIVSPGQFKGGWIKNPDPFYIDTIGYIQMPNLVAFANEGKPIGSEHIIPRTIPHYAHFEWHKPPDYSKLQAGKDCSEKIKRFYSFFKTYKEVCMDLAKNDKKVLVDFKRLLLELINDKESISLLNSLKQSSTEEEFCSKIGIVLSQLDDINVKFFRSKLKKSPYALKIPMEDLELPLPPRLED